MHRILWVFAVGLAACEGLVGPMTTDGGKALTDSGIDDAGGVLRDGGLGGDAGTAPDPVVPDAGVPDAGPFDAGPFDAGVMEPRGDAGTPRDGGVRDGGATPDAGAVDAGRADGGGSAFDAGVFDAGTPTGFGTRPFLFQADRARLLASIAANDPEATGSSANNPGTPLGFVTLCQAALANRADYDDVPTWHLAFVGWLTHDTAMVRAARDEALAMVAAAPTGDTGHGETYQHIEERMLNIVATADLAFDQFSPAQLAQVATWANGSLTYWNHENLVYWPGDEARNNYWQNAFLAHAIVGIASEGFNDRALEWRNKTVDMGHTFATAVTAPRWAGPVQTEGHYYAGYVKNAIWAMELSDTVTGTTLLANAQIDLVQQLELLMFQTRPNLTNFFEVGSEASQSDAPFTQLSLEYWHHLAHSAASTPQAAQAKAILQVAMPATFWGRANKGFASFYWSIRGVPSVGLDQKPERSLVTPTPGAGLIGLRSADGFQTTARAAVMFANNSSAGAAFSHNNPDAPGFQWASGSQWLVTDPEFFSNSGVMAEAGSGVGSDVSNIVTLAGHIENTAGDYPHILAAEDRRSDAVPHHYVQIDAAPYWSSASTYRRDYVWLDDLRVVVIFDRVVSSAAKTWRLHVPAQPTINGAVATYSTADGPVAVRSLVPASAWSAVNLNGSLTQRDVWRLAQVDSTTDYTSLKVLDVGSRVSAATLSTGAGWHQANLTVAGATRTVRFYADGTHALVQ